MSTSREAILGRLRKAAAGPAIVESADLPRVVPLDGSSPERLTDQFIAAAERLACQVHLPESEADAVRKVLEIAGGTSPILGWGLAHVPLPGLGEALAAAGIEVTSEPDPEVRLGLTGADAALAATGSLVLESGPGKTRTASLLPPVHIAVLRADRILPDLESWVAVQREKGLAAYRDLASVMLVSGPSRTADIAMQLTLGMHGPREVHVIVVVQPRGLASIRIEET